MSDMITRVLLTIVWMLLFVMLPITLGSAMLSHTGWTIPVVMVSLSLYVFVDCIREEWKSKA